ncbi:hypothetical protein PRK78_000534 [Emydomyces testavorans]|uniref:DUF7820 domain-containing protein n=1 Tax=Emydomyces testavorans TaxID=2070801 RepID=A0AAF0IFY8_9EURO|nr:hypothetical protein PRK78_000534 [Emydomyces testavorans]
MAEPPLSRPPSDARDESLSDAHTTQLHSLSIQPGLESPLGEISSMPDVFSDEFSLEPLDQFGSKRSSLINATSSDHSPVSPLPLNSERRPSLTSPFGDSLDSTPTEMQTTAEPPVISGQSRHVPVESNSAIRSASVSSATPGNLSPTRRSLSPSRFSIPRAMSPYRGQTGPSHPYAMYPQGIGIARSLSNSTVSTVRPAERNVIAAAPPQHPYAMYPQFTVPEEAADETQNSPIPIGFPGQNQRYQTSSTHTPNEVGDIVGPDGHTEQLPPYSRYPDSLPTKQELTSVEEVGTDVARAPDGIAASPQPPSENDASESRPDTNVDSDDTSGSFKEKLSRKGQKRVCCGIPLWMFFLITSVLLLGTVIGGVIGGLLGSQQGAKRDPKVSSTPTATVTITAITLDATPLPTDPGVLMPLPTGKFSIPAATLKNNSNNCLVDLAYGETWQCRTNGLFDYEVGKDEDDQAMIEFSSHTVSGQFYYGAQPPIFRDPDHPLELMLDKTNITLGPAFFFYTTVDKLVIIPEDDFPRLAPKRGLDGTRLRRSWSELFQRVSSSPGDRPWFCWWNNTLLEAFIYVNETSSAGEVTGSPSPSPTAVPSAGTRVYMTERTIRRRRDTKLPDAGFYPRAIKIEEKRIKSHGQPAYCEQRQVMDDGSVTRLSADQVPILEDDASTDTSLTSNDGKRIMKRDDHKNPGCFCQYFFD